MGRTSPETGLSDREAATRLAEFGPNALPEAPRLHPLRLLLAQFASPIVWALGLAGGVSAALGQWTDAIVIAAIVVLNAVVGFAQVWRAEAGIALLQEQSAPEARVVRGAQIRMVAARDVVPGDVLDLQAGDRVAADAVLLSSATLACNESPLTGESESVAKSVSTALNGDLETLLKSAEASQVAVFQGTHVTTGAGRAQVMATGMRTTLGRVAELSHAPAGVTPPTPLQQRLETVGRSLVWGASGIVVLLFGLGFLRDLPVMELFMTSVGLAVAAVPEGLPAAVTVALSLGASRMARRGELVRRLSAVETLGATDVICTDKTGTLTEGSMTVQALSMLGLRFEVTGTGYGPDGEVQVDGRAPAQRNSRHCAPFRCRSSAPTTASGC